MKHTPGPFVVSRPSEGVIQISAHPEGRGFVVAVLPDYRFYRNGGREANAALFSAAPDMLSCLKEARAELERCEPPDESDGAQVRYRILMCQIDSAIAKAKGGAR